MSFKITTLIENSADKDSGLECEHGLSFFIEKDDVKILFDTGQSGKFLSNAEKLGVDLNCLDYVAISHGHYDHSGGFLELASRFSGFELITGTGFFEKKYGLKKQEYKYLGNSFTEEDLKAFNLLHRSVSEPVTHLGRGIYILTAFPRVNSTEGINPRFKLEQGGELIADEFNDEILLAIDTPKGIVVVMGCSHPGVRNMLDAVKTYFQRPIHAVLGGTHLIEAGGKQLEESVKYLSDERIELLGVSHCTGKDAMSRLKESVPGYFHNLTGSIVILD
ncbi:MAG: MBL fold metallo-hydrolase [Spirochaetales bacterium]|nr:MBL fold metallo-hydrolase [Spirochaetales bacterium]